MMKQKLLFGICMILFSFALFNLVLAADVTCSETYDNTYCYPVCDECAAYCDSMYDSARCGHYPLIDLYGCAGEITTACDGNVGKIRYDTGITCSKYYDQWILFVHIGRTWYADGKCYCFATDTCGPAGCMDGVCIDVPAACNSYCTYNEATNDWDSIESTCGSRKELYYYPEAGGWEGWIRYADSGCTDGSTCYSCLEGDGNLYSCANRQESSSKFIISKENGADPFLRDVVCDDLHAPTTASGDNYCTGIVNYATIDVFDHQELDDSNQKDAYFCSNNLDCGSILVDYDYNPTNGDSDYISQTGWLVKGIGNSDHDGGSYHIGYTAKKSDPDLIGSPINLDERRGFEFEDRRTDDFASESPDWLNVVKYIGGYEGYKLVYYCGSDDANGLEHRLTIPIPAVQPACVHSDCGARCERDYYIAGAYCACPECKSSCTGYDIETDVFDHDYFGIYNYTSIYSAGTCPAPSVSTDFWYQPPKSCMEDLRQNLKSVCIYGEQCGDIYNLPYLTDKIYDGTDLLCTCDATYATEDNVKDCALNGICANTDRGVRVNDVTCGATGWNFDGYVEAEISQVSVYNTYGDFYRYNGNKPTTSRETSLTAFSKNPDNVVEFDDQDYISLQITVRSKGIADINRPFLLVTTDNFDPELHSKSAPNYLGAYKALLTISDHTIDVRKQGNKYLLPNSWENHYTIKPDGSSGLLMTSTLIAAAEGSYGLLLQQEAIAFWFKKEDGVHSRTSNIELVQETGAAWNGVMAQGDEMVFILYIKAADWDPNMQIYFWDLDTPLYRIDTINPAEPRDYLTHLDLSPYLEQIYVNDYGFENIHTYQVLDENVATDYNPCPALGSCDSDLKVCTYVPELPQCNELFCTYASGRCVNMFTGATCSKAPVCPSGYKLDRDGFCFKIPTQISCREGYVFDSATCRCVREFQYILDENKLNITGDVGSISGLGSLDCEDCLYCFASRLDSDSFDIFWIEQENPISIAVCKESNCNNGLDDDSDGIIDGDCGESSCWDSSDNDWDGMIDEKKMPMSSFYPELYQLNRWTGMYFMPRAYSIILDAQIGTIKGESEISFETSQDFSWATAVYSNSLQRDNFMLNYLADSGLSCDLPEDISADYYSLSIMQNEPMITFRAQEANNAPFEQDIVLTGMIVHYDSDGDGTYELSYPLDDRGTVYIDHAPNPITAASVDLDINLTDGSGNPLENFIIGIVNGNDAYPETVQVCDDCNSEGVCDCDDGVDNDVDGQIDEKVVEFLNWEFLGSTTDLTDSNGKAQISLTGLDKEYNKLWFIVNYISQLTPIQNARVELHIPGEGPIAPKTTGEDGEAIFDASGFDSLADAKAVMFDSEGNFLSSLNIYDISKVECTQGCGCDCDGWIKVCDESNCDDGVDNDGDNYVDEEIDDCPDGSWNCGAVPSFTSFDIKILGEPLVDAEAVVKLFRYEMFCDDCEPLERLVSGACPDSYCDDNSIDDDWPLDGQINERAVRKTSDVWTADPVLGVDGGFEFDWGTKNPLDPSYLSGVGMYVMEIGRGSGSDYESLSNITITIDNGDTDQGTPRVGIINRKGWSVVGEEVSGFTNKLKCRNNIGIKYPFEQEISIFSGTCDNMRIYDNSWNEVPYQVVESDFDTCKVALVVDPAEEVNFYYGSSQAPEPAFDSSWLDLSGVETGDLQFSWDVIDFEYSMDCLSGTGPCLRFMEDKINSDEWASHGLMWDRVIAENTEVGIYADGPVMKCFNFSYEVSMPAEVIVVEDLEGLYNDTVEYTSSARSHSVQRRACVYDGIPAIFETIEFIGDDISHTFSQSVRPTPMNILNSGLISQKSFSIPLPEETGYTTGSNAIWDGDLVLVTKLDDMDIEYNLNPQSVLVQDPYISDLYTQFNEITMSMPDSSEFKNSTYNVMNLDYETMEIMSLMGYQYDNGSMDYYSRRWTTSGGTANCDIGGYDPGTRDEIYGSTCDAGSTGGVAISLGIQRTGPHMIKFITPEENGQDLGVVPDITLFNSMGETPRVIVPEICDVEEGHFDCIVEEDEKGYAIDTSRMGYVANCMLYDPDFQDITTRYFNPYIFPMKWEIEYNLVVNPYIPTPVPVLIEEKDDQLMATTCGDWICQKDVEYCYNCPSDCSNLVNNFEPTIG